VHRLQGEGEEAVHQRVDVLGVERFRHGQGARDVGDQDRDLLALAGLGVAEHEHVPGQVIRGVGTLCRRAHLGARRGVRALRERGTAVQAEAARPGEVGAPARGARDQRLGSLARGVTPSRARRRPAAACTAESRRPGRGSR
jgi:hypothetical protein